VGRSTLAKREGLKGGTIPLVKDLRKRRKDPCEKLIRKLGFDHRGANGKKKKRHRGGRCIGLPSCEQKVCATSKGSTTEWGLGRVGCATKTLKKDAVIE